MEQMRILQTKTVRDLGLQLGLMAGVLAILYFLILYFTGAYLFDPFFNFDFWITIPFILIGIIALRKSADEVKVKHGLILGFYTVIVCASIVGLFYYVFLMYVNPKFIEQSFVQRIELFTNLMTKAVKSGDSDYLKQLKDQMSVTLKLQKEGITALKIAIDRILRNYLIGGIFTLATAILFRKTL
jgi:hypothetical protein